MKALKTIIALSIFSILLSCQIDHIPYQINGIIDNMNDDNSYVILSEYDPITQEAKVIDTVETDPDGNFAVEYSWSGPKLYKISFPGRQTAIIAIDEGQKEVNIHAEGKRNGTIEINGSPDSEKLLGYENFRKESNERLIQPPYHRRRSAVESGNVIHEIEAVMEYVQNSEVHRKELLDYTEENIGTSIALYATALRWTGDDEVERLERLVSAFEAEHPDLEMTVQMREKVNRFKKVAIGTQAPLLEAEDENGNTVRLNELLGQYTLVDFWASWCGPCISQVPDLQEAYSRFHEQGFEIVSVSVDREKTKWLESIDKLNLNWKHMSDVKGWQSELAKAYNVTFIPFNLLIDNNGTIIRKNLHSKLLQTTLAELFTEI